MHKGIFNIISYSSGAGDHVRKSVLNNGCFGSDHDPPLFTVMSRLLALIVDLPSMLPVLLHRDFIASS